MTNETDAYITFMRVATITDIVRVHVRHKKRNDHGDKYKISVPYCDCNAD